MVSLSFFVGVVCTYRTPWWTSHWLKDIPCLKVKLITQSIDRMHKLHPNLKLSRLVQRVGRYTVNKLDLLATTFWKQNTDTVATSTLSYKSLGDFSEVRT